METGGRNPRYGGPSPFLWFPSYKVDSDWLCPLTEGHGSAYSGLPDMFSPTGVN